MSGLNFIDIKSYWKERSSNQKELTVGFNGHSNIKEQNVEYQKKIDFVKSYLSPSLKTLDYGCGTGRWSNLFNDYLGVDIEQNLLSIATQNNPDKIFYLLNEPYIQPTEEQPLSSFLLNLEQFFSSTVLQHCDDQTVSLIFKGLAFYKKENITFILYENESVQKFHVRGRTLENYTSIISKFFSIKKKSYFSHIIHGEVHGVSLIKC